MPALEIKKMSVANLWGYCYDRVFAVPEIQREFVWDAKRAYRLLDSIDRSLPIGSFLIWEAKSDHRHLLRHAQRILPPYNSTNKKIWFLIDGQQRLSVLFRAKEGHSVQNYNGRILDFSKLCYSFDRRYDSDFVFIKKPAPALHVPIPDILAHDWKRRTRKLKEGQKKKIRAFRDRITRYQVPLMFLKTNRLEEIRETFLRINSGGLRISTADQAFTLASKLNLRRLINELRAGLDFGFGSVSPEIFQSAMALMVGQKDIGSDAVAAAIKKLEHDEIHRGKLSKKFARRWKGMEQSIKKAIDFLVGDIGVINSSYLPSVNMLTVLSYFFYANKGRQPGSAQRNEIRKWFWATGVGHRYAGRGYYQNIKKDIAFFDRLARTRKGKFQLNDLVPRDEIRRTDYQVAGSLNTSFFLLLLRKGPRYLATGTKMPIDRAVAIGNRKDKHHIFPKSLLSKQGLPRGEINSLANMCYLVAEENQAVGSGKPESYLQPFRAKKHFPSVMKSHLIPHRDDSGLWMKNLKRAFQIFQKQRADVICKEFEKIAGISLFRK
jgi:hypothetical protein